ncbi:NAD(P)/FAD-dependent oxidoreductase [Streptomyces sp. NPDC050560]|uniref:NAD(P)/FAD-dependent oxidoreductase n=1 Tax=Streptomyces sp. NPDC050560 TaxID=3365630 RepID=UPI00379FAE0A
MSATDRVLVVGASAAGLATAEALRRLGHRGPLTLCGAEPHLPYDRPPLSKQVLAGDWEPGRARLRPPDTLAALDAGLRLGDPAVALDTAARTVHTASGARLTADAVVLATGAAARPLPGPTPAGVHTLRTLDDALALRAALLAGRRLVVVGDGVLGCEIAATARGMGLHVTLAGMGPAPMADRFGPVAARYLADLHRRGGVHLEPGVSVAGTTETRGRVSGVRLADGRVLPADVVAVAIGAVPGTGWLTGSGLDTADGVGCDTHCRAADGIWAVGDVARFPHPEHGTPLRLENRTNATEQALHVARAVLGDTRPYRPLPYFWTDQFGVRVQLYGTPGPLDATEVVEGDPAAGRFVALYRAGAAVTGVLGWRMPKQARRHAQALIAPAGRPAAAPS